MTDIEKIGIEFSETGADKVAASGEKVAQSVDKVAKAQTDLQAAEERGKKSSAEWAAAQKQASEQADEARRRLEAFNAAHGKGTDSTKEAIKSIRELGKELAGIRSIGGGFEAFMNLGPGLAGGMALGIGAVMGLAKAFGHMIEEGRKAEESQVRLEAMIRATAGSAMRTAEEIDKMSKSLAGKSIFDDESIKDAASAMMRYSEVQGQTFDRAMKASVDLAAVMGTDVTQAATQLGRALQDPSAGLGMLRRAGIAFTEEQANMIKEMDKAGNLLGAQAKLLELVEGRTQGVAEAMAGTLTGSLKSASNAIGDSWEGLDKMLGVTDKLRGAVNLFTEALRYMNEQLEKAPKERPWWMGNNVVASGNPWNVDMKGGIRAWGRIFSGDMGGFLEGTSLDTKEGSGKDVGIAKYIKGAQDALQQFNNETRMMVKAGEAAGKAVESVLKANQTASEAAVAAVAKLAAAYQLALDLKSRGKELPKGLQDTLDFVDKSGGISQAGKKVFDAEMAKKAKKPGRDEEAAFEARQYDEALKIVFKLSDEMAAGSKEAAEWAKQVRELDRAMEVLGTKPEDAAKLRQYLQDNYSPDAKWRKGQDAQTAKNQEAEDAALGQAMTDYEARWNVFAAKQIEERRKLHDQELDALAKELEVQNKIAAAAQKESEALAEQVRTREMLPSFAIDKQIADKQTELRGKRLEMDAAMTFKESEPRLQVLDAEINALKAELVLLLQRKQVFQETEAKGDAKAFADFWKDTGNMPKSQKELYEAQKKATEQALKEVEALRQNAKAQGETASMIRVRTIAEKEAELATLEAGRSLDDILPTQELRIQSLRDEIAALRDRNSLMGHQEYQTAQDALLKKQKAEYDKFWGDIGEGLTDSLFRAFESGKGFGKTFVDSLKNLLKTTVMKVILEPVMKQGAGMLMQAVGGMFSPQGAGGGGGGGLNLNSLSSGYSMYNSMTGSGPIGAAYGSMWNSFATSGVGGALGLSAPTAALYAGVAEEAAALGVGAEYAATSMTALGATLGAVVPVIGAIVAVLAMSGIFDSEGGPKQGGFAQSSGMNLRPFYTETQANKDLQKIVTGNTQSYGNLARAFGIRPGDFNFAIGYDTDPQGTAQNRISAGADLNGVQVMRPRIAEEIGRDESRLQQEINNATGEALKGALMASEGIPQLAKTLIGKMTSDVEVLGPLLQKLTAIKFDKLSDDWKEMIEAFKGSDEEMGDFIAGMHAWTSASAIANDTLTLFNDTIEAMDMGTVDAFGKMGDGLDKLMSTFDGSEAAATQLNQALVDYQGSIQEVLVDLEKLRRGTKDITANMREGFLLDTLNPMQTYQYADQQYTNYLNKLDEAKTPADIERYRDQALNYLQMGWNQLDPAEQQRLLPQFQQMTTDVENKVDAATRRIGEALVTQAETVGKKIADAITAAYESKVIPPLSAAGDKLTSAASDFGTASERIHVEVTGTLTGGSEVWQINGQGSAGP